MFNDLSITFFVLVEDEILHTREHPFCFDVSCPCHEDADAITTLAQALTDGLMTPEEARHFMAGKAA